MSGIKHKTRKDLIPADVHTRALVCGVIGELGERGASSALDAAPDTLLRIAAGMRVRRATLAYIRLRLDERAAALRGAP